MEDVDIERKMQERLLHWCIQDLGYQYLGNLQDVDNKSIKEDLLCQFLEKRGYTKQVIKAAVHDLVSAAENRASTLTEANQEVYSLLRYGRQGVKDEKGNYLTVRYIDWENVEKNDFYVAQEVTVRCFNGRDTVRPDVVLYVNGIALGVFELKRSCRSVGEGIRQLLRNQKVENISPFFHTAQFLFAGNEAEGLRYGTINTPAKYYLKWKEYAKADDDLSKKISALQGKSDNRLRRNVISLCQKERFLSLIHDFVIFDGGIKKVCRHNQYFANIAARKRILAGEGGIIWNTQGSGKSLLMAWLTQWIIENIDDSRVVIITDREELDDQIKTLFSAVDRKVRRAESCQDLRDILNKKEDSVICSLIHKYGHNAGKQADIDLYRKELLKGLPPNFKAQGRIIAFIDECHRTNSGKLHEAVKTLMPHAVLIGFTGTPLLKKDKKSSLEVFGSYIHTYKFDEGVADGVILDLRYEARDVDQHLSSSGKVDDLFEKKTQGLTDRAKQQLKALWVSMNHLYSVKDRLDRITSDIIFDMNTKDRLKTDHGTAMLVAGSVYEACKYWDIFQQKGFKKCAIVTSYEPKAAKVRTATIDSQKESEEEYKKRIYEKMLNGKSPADFEKDVKKAFKDRPGQMKLLIVVDKLLTGFDAPSATYLYIDKSMRDHDLFQAICRVNRPDGESKEYGYIVDYKDLFKQVQKAISDYTSEAFDGYDPKDIDGLIKNRNREAKAKMDSALSSLHQLLGAVEPKTDEAYISHFCGKEDEPDDEDKRNKRDALYQLTTAATRGFMDACDTLVSDFGYTEEGVETLRRRIDGYNHIKMMVKLASADYIDLKPYEADMRYILDTYIRADDSRVISQLADTSLVELLVNEKSTTPQEMIEELPGDKPTKLGIIERNIRHTIIRITGTNQKYYEKLSKQLNELIRQRKITAKTYEAYLQEVVNLAQAVLHPETAENYPESIRKDKARIALYDHFEQEEELAIEMDTAIRRAKEPGWKGNRQKQNKIRRKISLVLEKSGWTGEALEKEIEAIFELIEKQESYDA